MSIGQFAHASGLTVKGLRFYDETGLLEPREVDAHTGYRRYGAGQLRRAALIKVLRQMGMGLAQVRVIVDSPDRADAELTRFTEELQAARARQDAAIAAGTATLASYDEPVEVQSCTAPEQPWVGAVMDVDLATVDLQAGAADYNAAFVSLVQALQAVGNPPVGSFWTEVRAGETPTSGQLVMCWPVAVPVDGEFQVEGLALEHGTLPARTESYVRVEFDSSAYPEEPPGEGAPHPAFLTLMEEVERTGCDAELVRQIGVAGPDGMPVGIDIAVTTGVAP